MEKRIWNTPAAVAEQFMADEYVNACWKIRCEVPWADGDSGSDRDGYGHDLGGHQTSSGTCGYADSHYITQYDNHRYKIVENSRFYGLLEAEFYNGVFEYNGQKESELTGTWSSTLTLTDAHLDEENPTAVYWRTTSGGNRYYHYGYVDLDIANRSQHS